jgi:peptide/nickel transport system permease protein
MSRVWTNLGRIAATALVGGLLSATLVRYAPGYELDEQQLDLRKSDSSRQHLLQARAGEQHVLRFYAAYLQGYVRGDWGNSRLLHRPVLELLKERAQPTLVIVLLGLGLAWLAGVSAALLGSRYRWSPLHAGAAGIGSLLQCLPAAVTSLLLLGCGARGTALAGMALALVVYPRVILFLQALLQQAAAAPHVQSARARGLTEWRILLRHVLPPAMPQILALAGVSVSIALGACIPVEMVLDVPGIGQLAWQAALGRDMPVLVSVTLLLSLVVTAVNCTADSLSAEREA